jgi:hypothetical protein
MDEACNTYGGVERCKKGFGGETGGKGTTWKTQTSSAFLSWQNATAGKGVHFVCHTTKYTHTPTYTQKVPIV